jgi:hypothetical protein
MQSSSLPFMLANRLVIICLGTDCKVFMTVALNSSKVLHPAASTFCWAHPQMFSMGLRSGLFGGQAGRMVTAALWVFQA